jgi:hypothetical protein
MDGLLVRTVALTLILSAMGSTETCLQPQKPGGKPKPAPVKPAPPPALDPWVGKYEDAKQNAKDRNVPLVVHILLDGEEATPRYLKEVLEDPELLRKSAESVVLIGNNGTHEKKDIDVVVDGQKTKKTVCSAFPMFTSCAQHQQAWNGLYKEYQEADGVLRCPQTLVISPAGEVVLRFNTGSPPDPSEVVGNIAAVQAKVGPGLTQVQLDEVRRLLDVGRNLTTSKTWPEAWKTFASVVAITANTVYGQEASKEQVKAVAGMQADLDRIATLLVPGTAVKGWQELQAFAKATTGTPIEKDVAARQKKAEGDKAIREEITAWKITVEADEILSQARDLYDQKQDKKGEKLVRKLLGKKYASTPAAEIARKLWPDITPDPPAPR